MSQAHTKHQCRCGAARKSHQIVCDACWESLPGKKRRQVFTAYAECGKGSAEYDAAVKEVFEFLKPRHQEAIQAGAVSQELPL